MAAVTEQTPVAAGRAAGGRPKRREGSRGGLTPWRWLILILAAVYFLLPLYAALTFAGWGSFSSVVHQSGFGESLWLSVRLAIIITLVTLGVVLRAPGYAHLTA